MPTAIALMMLLSLAACQAPSRPPPEAPTSAIFVVPASEVKGTCNCDDDEKQAQWLPKDGPASARRPVAYVKMTEWTPSSQVQEVEALVPARGTAPPTFMSFPNLTLAREIGETRVLW